MESRDGRQRSKTRHVPRQLPAKCRGWMVSLDDANQTEKIRVDNADTSHDECDFVLANPARALGHVLRSLDDQDHGVRRRSQEEEHTSRVA